MASEKTKKSSIKKVRISNYVASTILFGLSILLFCVSVIPGENVWNMVHNFLWGLFSISSIFWPLIIMYIAYSLSSSKSDFEKISKKVILSVIIIFLLCTLLYVFTSEKNSDIANLNYWEKLVYLYKNGSSEWGSGLCGGIIGILLVQAFGYLCAKIVIFILFFISIMLLTKTTPKDLIKWAKTLFSSIKKKIVEKKSEKMKKVKVQEKKQDFSKKLEKNIENDVKDKFKELKNLYQENIKQEVKTENKKEKVTLEEEPVKEGGYRYPSINLLKESTYQNKKEIAKELQDNGEMLVKTLESFSVKTKIINISRGPAVTRYEIQPASGVKISKITNLADDIALNLAASGVRIEAPIPGKAAVGVEIPNKIIDTVCMRELINSPEFRNQKSKLSVVLGKDIAGNTIVADLAKMPHLLIAGSTGSGKSVCINSFIISLLYKSSPEEVRLLMIDPKVVELSIYNGIKHLLVPVVTDACRAAGALNWAVTEMLRRYKVFAENNVRDLDSYNKFAKEKNEECKSADKKMEILPQIVIIIDELADLMMAAPTEVEDAICRLAQMARAAGMHLVIATQRPSVDVITGIIKANIPSRIALAVSSQVDSRTILDSSGAEKLLGRGDMLFAPIGFQKPLRVQGCYVTDKEIESVIDFIKETDSAEYDKDILEEIEKNSVVEKSSNNTGILGEGEDPLLKDAIRCIIDAGQASTSYIQRKLRVGYARAGRLMDEMEQIGIVGPKDGSKPRQIIITPQQLAEIEMRFMDE